MFGLFFNLNVVEFEFSGDIVNDLFDGFKWDLSWCVDFDVFVVKSMFVSFILVVLAFSRRRDEVKCWLNIVILWDFMFIILSYFDGFFNVMLDEFIVVMDFVLMATSYE